MMILIVPWIKDPFHTWNRTMVPQRTLGSVMLEPRWTIFGAGKVYRHYQSKERLKSGQAKT